MRRSPAATLLLLTVVALGAVAGAALWWCGHETLPPLPIAHDDGDRADTVAAAEAAAQRDPAMALGAATDEQQPLRNAEFLPSARPFPADANWIELTVVGNDDHAIAGAEVGWFGTAGYWQLGREVIDGLQLVALRQDPLRVSDRIGWRATADRDGRVRVAVSGETTIYGHHERLHGALILQPGAIPPPQGYRLVLLDDDRIDVQVFEHDDRPAVGVPIALACESLNQGYVSFLGPDALAVTDEHGRAFITGLTPHRKELNDMMPERQHRRVYLRPFLCGYDAPGELVSLDELPKQPIVLRLPPCGSVRVRTAIDTDGRVVRLQQPADSRFDGWLTAPIGDDGWAEFAHVPVGCRFRAAAGSLQDADQEFDGPRTSGERVDVTITTVASMVLVKARALGPDGPIANQDLELLITSSELPRHRRARTDGDGRFSVALGRVNDAGLAEASQFVVKTSPGSRTASGRLALPPQRFRAGLTDLGDLQLDRGTRLVSGRLERAGQSSDETWPAAWLIVDRFDAAQEPGNQWLPLTTGMLDVTNGTFEVYGDPAGQQLRLRLESQELLPLPPFEFTSGARDLVLTVAAGYVLAASVLLPEQAPIGQLSCSLEPAKPDAMIDGRLWCDLQHEQGPRYHLRWQGLPAGSYTLHVTANQTSVLRLTDIVLPPPDDGDARLLDIDLRQLLHLVTLEVHSEAPLFEDDPGHFALCLRDPARRGHAACHYGSQAASLLLPRRPLPAVLASPGHRPLEFVIDREQVEVRLTPWPEVTFVLVDVPRQFAAVTFHLRLEGSDLPQVADRLEELGLDDDGSMLSPSFLDARFEQARATTRIGEGPHRVLLTAYGEQGAIELSAVSPAVVQPTTDLITLRVAAEEWQRAAKTLGLEPK